MGTDQEEVTKKGKALYRWGAALTLLYVLIQVGYAYSEWDQLLKLDPNGYANFLAGIFSPLAFLWLVLGFFQQGIELRNSGKALWLQGEELRASVEQSKELVSVNREQLSHERTLAESNAAAAARASQPILRVVPAGGGSTSGVRYFEFKLVNSGPRCTDLKFDSTTTKASASGTQWFPLLDTGATRDLRFTFQGNDVEPFQLIVRFTDSVGRDGFARFEFDLVGSPEAPSLTVNSVPIEVGFS